jgi:hypothetical protein
MINRGIAGLFAIAVAFVAIGALPAKAASAMAAIPVGTAVTYKVTSSTTNKDGTQNSSHYLRLKRATLTSVRVSVDGAPAGSITLGPDGTPQIPADLQTVFQPFGLVAMLMKGAPQPLSEGASWVSMLSLPVKGQTANIPVTMKVSYLGGNGATVQGNGNATMDVQARNRSIPANLDLTANVTFSAAHAIASATISLSASPDNRRMQRRQGDAESTWTIAFVPQ